MPKTPEQEFRDFLFKRSQYLYRLENGAMKEMVASYKTAKKEIIERLIKLQDYGQGFTLDFRIQRLESQLGEINGYLRSAALDASGKLEETISSFVASDADAYAAMLSKQFGKVGVDIVSLPYAQIDSIANSPMLGEAIGDKMLWLNEEAVRKMRGELTQSIIQGEDMQQATSRLTNLKGTGATDLLIKRRAEIIARSEIQYVSNQVARNIYRENQDVLRGVSYSAALDRRTCMICASDDLREFDYPKDGGDHTGPPLPRHPLCRCTYVPITKTWKQLEKEAKVKPGVSQLTKDSFAGTALDTLSYNQWLKTLSTEEQIDILGPGRFKLWDEGKVTISDMAKDGKIYTIEQLENKTAKALGKLKAELPAKASDLLPAEVRANMTSRQIAAVDSYVPSNLKSRSIAELSERELAAKLGAEHIIGKRPFDVFLDNEFMEVKTLISGRGQIRIRPSSKLNKTNFVKDYKVRPHTVVVDKRPDSETFGKIFYRKGLGDFSPQTMMETKDYNHLRKLLKQGVKEEVPDKITVNTPLFKTTKAAEDFLKNKYKIGEVDYTGLDPKVTQLVNNQVAGFVERYGIKPRGIQFIDDLLEANSRTLAEIGEDEIIYFNKKYFKSIKEIENYAKFNYEIGHFSTSSTEHVINHELSHLYFFKRGGTEKFARVTLEKSGIKQQLINGIGKENLNKYLSGYSYGIKGRSGTVGEFYAEMMAKQLNGEKLHPVIHKVMKDINRSLSRNLKKKSLTNILSNKKLKAELGETKPWSEFTKKQKADINAIASQYLKTGKDVGKRKSIMETWTILDEKDKLKFIAKWESKGLKVPSALIDFISAGLKKYPEDIIKPAATVATKVAATTTWKPFEAFTYAEKSKITGIGRKLEKGKELTKGQLKAWDILHNKDKRSFITDWDDKGYIIPKRLLDFPRPPTIRTVIPSIPSKDVKKVIQQTKVPANLVKGQKEAIKFADEAGAIASDDLAYYKKSWGYAEEDIKTVQKIIDEDVANRMFINRKFYADSDSFRDVYETGVMKNQFQVAAEKGRHKATSSGSLDPTKGGSRDKWEQRIFNDSLHKNPEYKNTTYGSALPIEEANKRPVYGYMNDDDTKYLAGSYGQVSFKLKSELKNRVTFTWGNSSGIGFEEAKTGMVMTSKNNKKVLMNIFERDRDKIPKILETKKMPEGFSRGSGYIEMQVHGGLNIARDVEEIFIPNDNRNEHIRKLAEKFKIKWSYK